MGRHAREHVEVWGGVWSLVFLDVLCEAGLFLFGIISVLEKMIVCGRSGLLGLSVLSRSIKLAPQVGCTGIVV